MLKSNNYKWFISSTVFLINMPFLERLQNAKTLTYNFFQSSIIFESVMPNPLIRQWFWNSICFQLSLTYIKNKLLSGALARHSDLLNLRYNWLERPSHKLHWIRRNSALRFRVFEASDTGRGKINKHNGNCQFSTIFPIPYKFIIV